jgi:predicted RNA-binding Zn-ribbon protein involved in translation (DUF1610 family)
METLSVELPSQLLRGICMYCELQFFLTSNIGNIRCPHCGEYPIEVSWVYIITPLS